MLTIDKPLVRKGLRALGAKWPRPDSAIVCADSIDALAHLPAASVDLVFADCPYAISNGGTTCSGGERVAVDKGEWDRFDDPPAYYAFTRRWVYACRRVLKESGTLWISGTQHSIFACGWVLQVSGWHVLNLVTWQKPNPPGNLGCRQFTHSTEMLIWASPSDRKPRPHVFNDAAVRERYGGGKQVKDVWTIAPAGQHEREHGSHPTMKPLALLERVLVACTNPGDLVVDPFMGSGTTGVSAAQLGRSFIGIDSDPQWVELAEKRIYAVGAPVNKET